MAVDVTAQGSLRSRLAAGLSLAVLLLALAGGPAAGAAPATTVSLAPHAVPATSCQGLLACSNVTGTVGSNACNGTQACFHSSPWSGSVGNDACDGEAACDQVTGSVGTSACNGSMACTGAQGNVGKYACNGLQVCFTASGDAADCTHNQPGLVPAPCFATRSVMGSSARSTTAAQPVTLWATVAARYPVVGNPGGTFQFRLDGQPLGSQVAIDSHGRAHVTLHLRPGIHWVTGRYQGDGTFTPSVAVRLYQFVLPQ